MPLIPDDLRAVLLANGARAAGGDVDPVPVVKLFVPGSQAVWLLTEIDPEDSDTAYGLCDLSLGAPEVGSVSLAELAELTGPLGLKVERDLHFRADRPLSRYESDAIRSGAIRA